MAAYHCLTAARISFDFCKTDQFQKNSILEFGPLKVTAYFDQIIIMLEEIYPDEMNKLLPIDDSNQVEKALKWLGLLLEPAVKEVALHLTVPKYTEQNPLNLRVEHWII